MKKKFYYLKKIFSLGMTVLVLIGCKENTESSEGDDDINEPATREYDLLLASTALEGDKTVREEIRYIVELTEKLSDANQRFLSFAKNYDNLLTLSCAEKDLATEENKAKFVPPKGAKSFKMSNKGEDFLSKQ